MDFAFTEEQDAVRELAARILGDLSTPERLKEVEATEDRIDRKLWAELGSAGLLGRGPAGVVRRCRTRVPGRRHRGRGGGSARRRRPLHRVGRPRRPGPSPSSAATSSSRSGCRAPSRGDDHPDRARCVEPGADPWKPTLAATREGDGLAARRHEGRGPGGHDRRRRRRLGPDRRRGGGALRRRPTTRRRDAAGARRRPAGRSRPRWSWPGSTVGPEALLVGGRRRGRLPSSGCSSAPRRPTASRWRAPARRR